MKGPGRAAAACALVATGALLACAGEQVHVRTDPPGGHVVLDGADLGTVGPAGVDVEIGPGVGDVPVLVDGVAAEVPRSDVHWGVVAAAVGAAACCAPSLALGALCIANPALWSAPFLCLAGACNPAPCIAAAAAPTWASLPFVAAGGCAGLTPLALLLVAEKPPPDVILRRPPASPATGSAAAPSSTTRAASTQEMPW